MKIEETTLINRLTVEMKGREIFRCDVRNLKFNAECDDDVVCLKIISSVEETRERFYSDSNIPKFASVKEGKRYIQKFQSLKVISEVKSELSSDSTESESNLVLKSNITAEIKEGDILSTESKDNITDNGSNEVILQEFQYDDDNIVSGVTILDLHTQDKQIEEKSTGDTHNEEVKGEDELYETEDKGELFFKNGSENYDEETLGGVSRMKNDELLKFVELELVSHLLGAINDEQDTVDEDETIFRERGKQFSTSDDNTSSNHKLYVEDILSSVLQTAVNSIGIDDKNMAYEGESYQALGEEIFKNSVVDETGKNVGDIFDYEEPEKLLGDARDM